MHLYFFSQYKCDILQMRIQIFEERKGYLTNLLNCDNLVKVTRACRGTSLITHNS